MATSWQDCYMLAWPLPISTRTCLGDSGPKQTTFLPGRSQDPGVQPYQTVKGEREAKVSSAFVQKRYLIGFKPKGGTRVLRDVPANISPACLSHGRCPCKELQVMAANTGAPSEESEKPASFRNHISCPMKYL